MDSIGLHNLKANISFYEYQENFLSLKEAIAISATTEIQLQ